MSTVNWYWQVMLEFLGSPIGVFSIGAGGIWFIVLLTVRNAIWPHLSLMIFFASISAGAYRWIDIPLIGPLQVMRTHCRTAFVLLLLLAIPWTIKNLLPSIALRKRILPSMVAFLIMQLVFDGRLILGGYTAYGAGAIFIHVFVFLMFLAIRRQWDPARDSSLALGALMLAASLFVACSLVQLAANSGAVVWRGRFSGLTANAQHAAQFLAVYSLAPIFFALSRDRIILLRTFATCLLAVILLLLVWTGSRTGGLMVLTAILVLFRRRAGTFVVLGGVVCVMLLLISQFFTDSLEASGRLFSLENTRAVTWRTNLDAFLQSPLFGDVTPFPDGRPPVVESSYLAVLRLTGIVGSTVMLIWLAFLFRDLILIARQRLRARLTNDIVLGAIAAIIAGAIFEGYLLAVISVAYISLELYLVIGADFRQPQIQSSWQPYTRIAGAIS